MAFKKEWHLFMIRKALLTNMHIGFVMNGPIGSSRFPLLGHAAASLLYIDLISIIGDAFEKIMSPAEFQRGKKTKNRIQMLAKAGRLLDPAAMLTINDRRNEIAHEADKDATVRELDEAVNHVAKQLKHWGLLDTVRKYEVQLEKSAIRAASDPQWLFEWDFIVRVLADQQVAAEYKNTHRIAHD